MRQESGVKAASEPFAQALQGAVDAAAARRLDTRLETVQRKAHLPGHGVGDEGPDLEKQKQQLWQASQELEAIFLQQMVSAMQRTVPRDEGVIQRSQAEELFQGMLDEELAKVMAESGEMGLAKALYQQLVQSLEEREKAKNSDSEA
ncbi:MAG: hypothetical protein GX855_03945 [Firmicutes bacterium]|nr:hypothetical protein [Bacillota bacterium]